jgi:hypothetical protein
MAAWTSSHARDPVPQVAPEPDESAPSLERRIGEVEKRVDEKRADARQQPTERATKAGTAKPAR